VLLGVPRPGYLGVLYATADGDPAGVRVLAVIAGSPAERAGFMAAPRPSPKTDLILKVAAVLIGMTPAAPLAIALGLMRDALEFNNVMRLFGLGDTVPFVVQRGSTQVRLSAQLAAEP
jgi:S1-C subfamily serine protease